MGIYTGGCCVGVCLCMCACAMRWFPCKRWPCEQIKLLYTQLWNHFSIWGVLPKSPCIFLMQFPLKRNRLTSFYIWVFLVFPQMWGTAAHGFIPSGWYWWHEARMKSLAQKISLNQHDLNVEPASLGLWELCITAGQIYMLPSDNIAEKNKISSSGRCQFKKKKEF